ncbi:hypothetical protein [Actinocorallia populi]|uniref:hypothetical protein n=1 Tax=Actinocorallia populi TaxID=2079200 RepID=UPI000D093ABC|nr:hypothetical protein [Actinocorallia populi]
MTTPSTTLPPVAPDVTATAVESLTSRLRKKLDAAVEQYAAAPVTRGDDGSLTVVCGEDTAVTLTPGPAGTVSTAEQAVCSCLLAPRCLHRAAVLTACPIADPAAEPEASADAPAPGAEPAAASSTDRAASGTASGPEAGEAAGTPAAGSGKTAPVPAEEPPAKKLTAAQVRAAEGLWKAAAAVLAAGAQATGSVPQAELLRAAHTARLAGLYRAEAAALRVVRGVKGARARYESHRLADLAAALGDLLLTASLLATGRSETRLVGTARRDYRQGSSLRVQGVFREPVISATGYGGVVTHLVSETGDWYSIADVKPGGPSRARGAATAPVALGGVPLDHAGLARSGLTVIGTTVSPDGRLGAGKGVRALPGPGLDWAAAPFLFGRTLAEAVAERLAVDPGADPVQAELRLRRPVGCDLVILGPSGDHVLARELHPETGEPQPVLVRLVPAHRHPDLAHTANLRQLAARPGVHVRVVARVDPTRATTLTPLAVGPVPGHPCTLRLPAEWQGHADLGYDHVQGAHFPAELEPGPPVGAAPDPLTDSPLWRVRRLVELAAAGGRRAVAESARGEAAVPSLLDRTGFHHAATLTTALTNEAARHTRDVFGRLADTDPRHFAAAWLASSVHLTAAEHALVRATWEAGQAS